jgi:hypothetical protein
MIALEPIYAALFAKLTAISGINYSSRRPVVPQNLADGQFPSVMLNQLDIDHFCPGDGTGTVFTIPVEVLLYTNKGADPNVVPTIELNGLIDQVRASINAVGPPGTMQTLGGLVKSVYTTGKIEVFEGNQGQFGIAIVPITILAGEN